MHDLSFPEIDQLASRVQQSTVAGDVICLEGPLGSGKTAFVRAFCQSAGVSSDEVSSPTFVLLHLYEPSRGPSPIYHFDLYRLKAQQELDTLDFDEIVWGEGVTLIEWPQIAYGSSKLPESRLTIQFDYASDDQRRQVDVVATGSWTERFVRPLC